MTRIRSPNYPQIELSEAIALVAQIHKKEGTNYATREVIAELLGYSSVNGASEKKISAITAYGLLDRNSERELRVSEVAMRILHPESEREKSQALTEAATSPNLFREINEKWPDTPPSDASLRSYLIRNGFNQNSVDQVVSIYRASSALGNSANRGDNPDELDSNAIDTEEDKESVRVPTAPAQSPTQRPTKPIVFDMETISGTYSFDNSDDLADFIHKLAKIMPLLPKKPSQST